MPTMTRDTREGYEAIGSLKTATSYRMWLFSGGWPRFDGWPAKNIHTDLESARSSGLPARAASGAMMQGYLTELMLDLFGDEWMTNGRMSLKFIRIVDVNDEIVSKACVASRREDESGIRFDLELSCENQRGEKVVVGTGTGWVE